MPYFKVTAYLVLRTTSVLKAPASLIKTDLIFVLEEATAMARLISAPLVPTTPLSVLNPFPTASLVLLASFALKAQALNSNAVLQAFTVLTEQHLPLKYHALLAHSQHYNTKATHTGQRVSEEPVS